MSAVVAELGFKAGAGNSYGDSSGDDAHKAVGSDDSVNNVDNAVVHGILTEAVAGEIGRSVVSGIGPCVMPHKIDIGLDGQGCDRVLERREIAE